MTEKTLSMGKAVKAFCKGCKLKGDANYTGCPNVNCQLHAFRFGKDPARVNRVWTDEQKAAASERLKKARGIKKLIS